MRVIIDRFEGAYAVCEKEDREMINISKTCIPSDAREGDVLVIEGGIVAIDIQETVKRKSHMDEIVENLWDE
jgi:hypothetical protein